MSAKDTDEHSLLRIIADGNPMPNEPHISYIKPIFDSLVLLDMEGILGHLYASNVSYPLYPLSFRDILWFVGVITDNDNSVTVKNKIKNLRNASCLFREEKEIDDNVEIKRAPIISSKYDYIEITVGKKKDLLFTVGGFIKLIMYFKSDNFRVREYFIDLEHRFVNLGSKTSEERMNEYTAICKKLDPIYEEWVKYHNDTTYREIHTCIDKLDIELYRENFNKFKTTAPLKKCIHKINEADAICTADAIKYVPSADELKRIQQHFEFYHMSGMKHEDLKRLQRVLKCFSEPTEAEFELASGMFAYFDEYMSRSAFEPIKMLLEKNGLTDAKLKHMKVKFKQADITRDDISNLQYILRYFEISEVSETFVDNLASDIEYIETIGITQAELKEMWDKRNNYDQLLEYAKNHNIPISELQKFEENAIYDTTVTLNTPINVNELNMFSIMFNGAYEIFTNETEQKIRIYVVDVTKIPTDDDPDSLITGLYPVYNKINWNDAQIRQNSNQHKNIKNRDSLKLIQQKRDIMETYALAKRINYGTIIEGNMYKPSRNKSAWYWIAPPDRSANSCKKIKNILLENIYYDFPCSNPKRVYQALLELLEKDSEDKHNRMRASEEKATCIDEYRELPNDIIYDTRNLVIPDVCNCTIYKSPRIRIESHIKTIMSESSTYYFRTE